MQTQSVFETFTNFRPLAGEDAVDVGIACGPIEALFEMAYHAICLRAECLNCLL